MKYYCYIANMVHRGHQTAGDRPSDSNTEDLRVKNIASMSHYSHVVSTVRT